MAYAQIFRSQDNIRLSQSPSGGGNGNPAWDFQYFIPDPKVGRRYQIVMRVLYTPLTQKVPTEQAHENARKDIKQVSFTGSRS